MRRVLTCLLAVVGLVAIHGSAKAAPVLFQGYYAPANWTTTSTGSSGGSVDWSGAPPTGVFISSDNGFGGNTSTTIVAPNSGTVSFNWSYATNDNGFDGFGYLLNGVYTPLATNNGQNGFVSFNVNAGDTFGFRSTSIDGIFGAGFGTVTNFDAPAVPEPATMAIFGGMAVAGLIGYRRRTKTA